MTVDKNYMLLIITDRAIDAICFFETHEEAYQATTALLKLSRNFYAALPSGESGAYIYMSGE